MHKKFHELYGMIVDSNDREKMSVLGSVTKSMMMWMIENRPEQAEEYLEELCAIKWNNYLTKKEAEEVVLNMEPKPKWTKEQVKRELEVIGVPCEEMPYYNWCALYTTISMIYSDSGETLKKYAFGEVADEKKLFALCYHLAVDKLKDKDEVFNIRKYFGL